MNVLVYNKNNLSAWESFLTEIIPWNKKVQSCCIIFKDWLKDKEYDLDMKFKKNVLLLLWQSKFDHHLPLSSKNSRILLIIEQ